MCTSSWDACLEDLREASGEIFTMSAEPDELTADLRELLSCFCLCVCVCVYVCMHVCMYVEPFTMSAEPGELTAD
jgi:hypothetical protein